MKKQVTLLLTICLLLVAVTGITTASYAVADPTVLAAASYITLYGGTSGYSFSSIETIQDFLGNTYKLCNISPNGYLIMYNASTTDTPSYRFVELDEESASPYTYFSNKNIIGEKLYACPGQYFVKTSDNLVYDTYGSNFQVGSELHNYYTVASTNIKEALTDQNESATSPNTTYISNYMYFENVDNLPGNINGTCGFNCLGILLGYYNVYSNSTIIPNDFKQLDITPTSDDFNFYSISIDNIINLPTINNKFITELVQYKYPDYINNTKSQEGVFLVGGFSAGAFRLNDTLNQFFTEYHTSEFKSNFTYTPHILDIFTMSSVKSEIDNGRPVILSMLSFEETWINETGETQVYKSYAGHNVIAYGYKNNAFIVCDPNTGGRKTLTGGLIAEYLTFQYTGEHVHSTDMRFNNRGCFGTFCPCGEYTVCEHTVVDTDDLCCCASCSLHIHNTHTSYTATHHYTTCSRCGYSVSEPHSLRQKLGGVYCTGCGYDSTISGEITLKDPDKNN